MTDGYYVTNSNELFEDGVKIADDVVHYYGNYYLTTTNELYNIYIQYNNHQRERIVNKIADNVKEFSSDYYITTSNELYALNGFTNTYEKVADNVIDGSGGHYITTANELYVYEINDSYNYVWTKKKENAKRFWYTGEGYYYLTTSDELHLLYKDYSLNEWKDELINTNVIDCYKGGDRPSGYVERYGLNWYKVSSGDIYLHYSWGGG